MIRGHSVDNPVLLFLAGGPGGSEYGAMRRHLPELEEHFTVVTWDQRGTGKSYPELDPTDTVTLEGSVADTIEVTDYLRDRFEQDQIYLLGQSWGTTLGVLAVQEHARAVRAFIGTGQMVSQLETDRIFYDDTLDWARANGRRRAAADLLAASVRPRTTRCSTTRRRCRTSRRSTAYDHSENSEGEGQMSENLLVAEYTLIDQVHVLPAFMDTFAVLYPQLQDIDFREHRHRVRGPDVLRAGRPRGRGRAEPFDEWYPMIEAPNKDRVGARHVRPPAAVRATRRVRRLHDRHRARHDGTDRGGAVTMTGIALAVEQVTKRYGDRAVVDDLSFTVAPGRVTGFLGPNGSGKSTTMKMLLGLAATDAGSTRVGDRAYVDLDDPTGTVGAALETNAFHPGRSGRDHLRILACAAGVPDARVAESLATAGLADAADRRAGTYSLGMRQRLGLAAALLCDPPVLVLDEPGNGLDPQGVRELRDLFRERAASGGTVFVSSHLLGEVEHLVDDVVVIDKGQLVTSGALAELRHETALVRSPDALRLAEALRTNGAAVELDASDGAPLLVRGSSLAAIGHVAFTLGVEVSELGAHAGSLEDLFMNWTNQSGAAAAGDEEVVG